MEAPPRFELGMRGVADPCALPLGYSAIHMVGWTKNRTRGHEDFQSSALPTELSSPLHLLPKQMCDILSLYTKEFHKVL